MILLRKQESCWLLAFVLRLTCRSRVHLARATSVPELASRGRCFVVPVSVFVLSGKDGENCLDLSTLPVNSLSISIPAVVGRQRLQKKRKCKQMIVSLGLTVLYSIVLAAAMTVSWLRSTKMWTVITCQRHHLGIYMAERETCYFRTLLSFETLQSIPTTIELDIWLQCH